MAPKESQIMKLPFKTAWDAARGVVNEFYTEKHALHLRLWPYNSTFADEPKNWWWLSPSNQLVAHKHGKFLFTKDDNGRICIGLAMEKGLGEGFSAVSEYKQWTMDKSWQWHRFHADLINGKVEAALGLIEDQSGAKPMVLLDWNRFPYKPDITGKAHFEWGTKKDMKCTETSDSAFKNCTDVRTIQEALEKHIKEPDSWCDFRIMLAFEPSPEGGKGCWTLPDIKTKLLEPLERWVV